MPNQKIEGRFFEIAQSVTQVDQSDTRKVFYAKIRKRRPYWKPTTWHQSVEALLKCFESSGAGEARGHRAG